MLCPAKPAMERGLPDKSSEYADEGTAAHELAARALLSPRGDWFDGSEMSGYVERYVEVVRDYLGDGELFVEQAVPIAHITGEDGAEGTADAVILRGDEIIVIDLKYGRGVEVSAEGNPQLMLYALGALEKFGLSGDFQRARMVISQPRVSSAPSEFAMTVAALVEWGLETAWAAATKARFLLQVWNPRMALEECKPHPDACRFCKAKGKCPALDRTVQDALGAEFTDLTTSDKIEQEAIVARLVGGPADTLGPKMDVVELIEMWCKAIRGAVEARLLDGQAVEGYKLVQGKRGNRAWVDAAQAETMLKSMRLKKEEMYEFKVISPTTAEKILKAQPKRWKRVAPLITQGEGKPSVAPMSDKRPAIEITPLESEFIAIDNMEDLL